MSKKQYFNKKGQIIASVDTELDEVNSCRGVIYAGGRRGAANRYAEVNGNQVVFGQIYSESWQRKEQTFESEKDAIEFALGYVDLASAFLSDKQYVDARVEYV